MNKPPPLYVLDSNVFIGAHRRYYSLDLCPGFWTCLLYYCEESQVRSIDRVRDEILVKPDRLSEWVNKAPEDLFVSTAKESVIDAFRKMNKWVQENSRFQPQAIEEFARVADGWLVAYAKVHNAVVVTHEVLKKDANDKVPLPNVCKQFGVKYCNTFAMLRELEVRFDWIR